MGNHTRHGSTSGNTSNLPSRSFRYLQEQYSTNNGDNEDSSTTMTTVEETYAATEGAGLRRGSDGHMPSRAFKFLQDQYDAQQGVVNRPQGVNNREDLAEIYNKRKRDFERSRFAHGPADDLAPPSFREREPEAPRYTGSTVPSRSFRFLQAMTQGDQQNDSAPIPGYNKPQQMMSKYEEQNFSSNKINTHPSRSFKYLQEMTTEQPPMTTMTTTTVTRTGRCRPHAPCRVHCFLSAERRVSSTNMGQPLQMNVEVQQSQPFIQVSTTSSSSRPDELIDNLADEIAATDF